MGPAGIQGESGEPGPIGHPGPQGLAGLDGLPGARGEVGPRGPPGDQGEKGVAGQSGEPGVNGVPGPQGFRGPQGEQGEIGEPGIQGVRGLAGLRGRSGEEGPKGEKGQPGLPGLPGFSLPGLPGVQGEAGDDVTFDMDALERYFLELLHEEIAKLDLEVPVRQDACDCGEVVTTTTQAPTTTTSPPPEFDLVFLVDGSKSITNREWESVKGFLSKVTSAVENIDPTVQTSTLVIIQYSDTASTTVSRTVASQADDIRARINAMVQIHAGTDIYGGFNYLLNPVNDAETGFARENDAAKYLFTITDTCPTRKSYLNRDERLVSDAREIFSKQQVLAIGPEATGCDVDFEDFISTDAPLAVESHEALSSDEFVENFVQNEI